MFETTRRRTLQALGIGGTAAVAGCTAGAPRADDAAQQRRQVETTATPTADRVAADPTDIPAPIDRDRPKTVEVTLRPEEVTAEIEDGVTFDYMTYNGRVPGPMIRVRQGDTVDLTFENPDSNALPHNVDFHAVYGPGGGAEATMTAPGETAHLRFKATYPGAFIYHCAVPNLDMHISAGMFGMILVEPKGGLPEVDHELYLGQHEIYTDGKPGQEGKHSFDVASMRDEEPTYVVMNGEKYAMTPDRHGPAATVGTGETARVFFVTGGPNLTSSFHPIGNVWKECWAEGALASDPERNVQTKPVAPGSCAVATMEFPVPGPVKLVDHALSRVARRGCMAVVAAEGEPNPEVFDPEPEA
ncbi:MAG: copper-containing nitrite reductase [Haloferacaceae archaeon]